MTQTNTEERARDIKLKSFLVMQNPDNEYEVWTRHQYEQYIAEAVSVGGGSAYKIITDFEATDDLLARTGEKEAEIEALKADNERLQEAIDRAGNVINDLQMQLANSDNR